MSVEHKDRAELLSRLRAQLIINDPFLGETDVAGFETGSAIWPGERWSSVTIVNVVDDGQRQLVECRFVPADGSVEYLPVGFVFEANATGGPTVYVYSDHHLVEDRAPILSPIEGIHPWQSERDVLYAYFQALNGNRIEDVLNLFEEDGYFRHSNAETFKGHDRLREDFSKMMGNVGIRIQYCRFTDDGTTCVVECYMPTGRPAIAVYERGQPGKLRAIRIYL